MRGILINIIALSHRLVREKGGSSQIDFVSNDRRPCFFSTHTACKGKLRSAEVVIVCSDWVDGKKTHRHKLHTEDVTVCSSRELLSRVESPRREDDLTTSLTHFVVKKAMMTLILDAQSISSLSLYLSLACFSHYFSYDGHYDLSGRESLFLFSDSVRVVCFPKRDMSTSRA